MVADLPGWVFPDMGTIWILWECDMPEIFRNPSGGMPEIRVRYGWNRHRIRAVQGAYMGGILCMSSITPL